MKDVKTTGRYSNCIIPLGGAVWVKDADNYASIQVHENSKLADLDWLAYDEHGNNITKHIAIDWTGVDTSKSGKTYEILVVCKEVLTNVTIIVVPEKQRLMKLVPANVTMLGTNKTNPRRYKAESGYNPGRSGGEAIDDKGMQAKVLVDDMKGPLEDGDHIITWRNSIVSNLSITAIVTVGNPEDMKPAPVEVVGVTDGYGGYGNPPPASSYAKAQPAKIAIGGELDESIGFLAKYEAVMCGTPERDIVEEWQLYLHRYLRKIMINSENNATFTLFLDRCDELPHIYGELKLTRNIMDMIPHALPEWYFRFIWLVTKAANPVTRAEISTTTNYGQLLVDIPNEELDFITQYFASVAVVSF